MKNFKSLDQLKKASQFHFKQDESLKKVFATSDGNIFLERNENAAKAHKKAAKVSMYEISREEAFSAHADETGSEETVALEADAAKTETGAEESIPEVQPVGEAPVEEAPVEEAPVNPDDLTVARLKDDLEHKGVTIPKNAKKADLVELWNQHCK